MIKLSVCIATYNRGAFIAETLDSIIPQLTDEVEILIVDGASPDNTEEVVRDFVKRHPQVRYFREAVNSGADGDYDKAVGYARGEYCWLFPDDDLLAPDAMSKVLGTIAEDPDLILVDATVKDEKLKATLQERRLSFSGTRRYSGEEADRVMADGGNVMTYIGSVIIRRNVWMARDRRSYYGSLFIHVGVVFQQPPIGRVVIIGEPLILIRYGNAMWSPRAFEIWALKWPELIWGFQGFSDKAKASVARRYPWRHLGHLLTSRAKGGYGYPEYRRLFAGRRIGWWRLVMLAIALIPGKLVHLANTIYLCAKRQFGGTTGYELFRCSPHINRPSRWLASKCRTGHRLVASD